MKRFISAALCVLILAGVTAGCGGPTPDNGKLSIVVTIFPEYDWVMQILGDGKDRADVTMLLDNGVDLHSYKATADDIIKISTCDMFVYVGGESDGWVTDVLAGAKNKSMTVVNLLEALGDDAKEEETGEGMQEEEHDHDDGDGEEGLEYDEHVWLSLKNAEKLCRCIAGKLGVIDAEHKDEYAENVNAYIEKLRVLDAKYAEAVAAAGKKTLLFGDRFPFRYLTDDYGLSYFAAFSGCSAESEASFETVVFLAGKVDELGLCAIMQIESADGKLAATIRDTTKTKDQIILTLDSMQSTTSADVADGASYLSIMEKNLTTLKEALK
ncbi:MAG: zinc ABC transporter substrate-binding protein [Clostridia bacterium]|nr:zinc ABC transporter substrate-binding protein [Clostridia bacterium]